MAIARPAEPYPDPSWWGWGDPGQVPVLPEAVRKLLTEGLGVRAGGARPQSLDDVALPDIRLGPAVLDELGAVVGPAQVSTDPESRIRHSAGKSTPDLLRLRAGDAGTAPDAVLTPASHDEVLGVLGICSDRRVAVVPFGGGTSVVGGLAPEGRAFTGVIALDLRRMNAMLELDEVSRVAVLEAGLRAPQAEALLSQRGYTLGHFPQSFEYATIGGFAAARSSGQASAGYGRFDEMVVSLQVATPAGTLALGRAPKSAAGPDLRQLVLGSEGAFGVITSVGVTVRPLPEARRYEGWRLESFAAGIDVLRALAQDGPRPTVLRLSDEVETALNLAAPGELGSGGEGALAIIGYEGTAAEVKERSAAVARVLEAAGAQLDLDAGEAWARERYRGPYLRDALLDAGALAETLETATFWSRLPALYEAVGSALRDALTARGTPPVVLCHVSHVYSAGASLYFTVGAAQADDPLAQWEAGKAAASDAIAASGGSITHHHGVGVDHRPWYVREVGPLAVGALRAVKAELDPAGIMNPGVLIPRE
ncbi:MAG TPA: FAD-binding oxidoreductase [Solirubrobacteraceae bacterium]|nr:FAD-binding oxidoreductase [Solirubrobacteraceae bacterium]